MEISCPTCEELMGIERDESGAYECPHCDTPFEYTSSLEKWIFDVEEGNIERDFLISEDVHNTRSENILLGLILIPAGFLFFIGWMFVFPALLGLLFIRWGFDLLLKQSITTKRVSFFDSLNSRIVQYTLKDGHLDHSRINEVDIKDGTRIVTCSYWSGGGDSGAECDDLYMTQESVPVKFNYPGLKPSHALKFSEYLEIPFTPLRYNFKRNIDHDELRHALR
ncbi:MAG: hypothetical protein GWP25_04335 [Euryarchaeota archaeon]|nr:hypothetical protein [Euryarchaeota archaeon]